MNNSEKRKNTYSERAGRIAIVCVLGDDTGCNKLGSIARCTRRREAGLRENRGTHSKEGRTHMIAVGLPHSCRASRMLHKSVMYSTYSCCHLCTEQPFLFSLKKYLVQVFIFYTKTLYDTYLYHFVVFCRCFFFAAEKLARAKTRAAVLGRYEIYHMRDGQQVGC